MCGPPAFARYERRSSGTWNLQSLAGDAGRALIATPRMRPAFFAAVRTPGGRQIAFQKGVIQAAALAECFNEMPVAQHRLRQLESERQGLRRKSRRPRRG
jgi:hypothetical protein